MKELDQLVENFFQPKQESITLESLLGMVEEQICEMKKVTLEVKDGEVVALKEEDGKNTLTVAALPDIPVSELGWSSLQTDDEGKEIPSAQRQQLMDFLKNIQGEDLQQKLKSLSDFYELNESTLSKISGGSSSGAISKALSYLTFYKTLTSIITNFNSASAGFAFESFLAVLLGGQQIATGNATIADFTTAPPDSTPVSLKLYKEGQLKVGGSYTDLVNDLVGNGAMQYVCVTKRLSGSDLNVSGTLTFYRFTFNLDNVFNIISRSSGQSPKCILLPRVFMRTKGEQFGQDIAKKKSIPSAQELENEFWDRAESVLDDPAVKARMKDDGVDFSWEPVKQAVDWANNDDLFYSEKKKIRGRTRLNPKKLQSALSGLFGPEGEDAVGLLLAVLDAVNNELIKKYAPTKDDENRRKELNKQYFYGKKSDQALVEASRKFYQNASDDLKRECLKVSLGYIDTRHFELNENMIKSIDKIAQPTPGQLFPEGQTDVRIGAIEIGYEKINTMLQNITSIINESVFDIFNNLKALTSNIQGYFAGGLDNDVQADTAITAANNIETKTKEVKSKTT
jgi:hypothetical protein